jgi:hypothetical protein
MLETAPNFFLAASRRLSRYILVLFYGTRLFGNTVPTITSYVLHTVTTLWQFDFFFKIYSFRPVFTYHQLIKKNF